jgi:CxxC motif-containing protein (DUF1111 family)
MYETQICVVDIWQSSRSLHWLFPVQAPPGRTPRRWRVRLQKTVNGHTDLLHDGRARGFVEAIVWHGKEAQRPRDRFLAINKHDREALVKFLELL